MARVEAPKAPSILARLSARLIDGALVWLVIVLLAALPSNSDIGAQTLIGGVTLFVGVAILVVAARSGGRTPGRAILGLRVADANGSRASHQRVLTRELLAFGIFAVALGLTSQATGAVLGLFTNAVAAEFAGISNETALIPVSIIAPWTAAIALTYGALGVAPGGLTVHDRLAGTKLIRK